MPEPPDGLVHLPGGLWWDGELLDSAEVRELNGADEVVLAKAAKNATSFVASMIKVLLTRAVVSVGHHEPPSKEILDALLVGDRDLYGI